MLWQITKEGFEFNSLEAETMQRNKIEELYVEGKATQISDNVYLVSHEAIAALSPAERALLDLPKVFPYRLRISSMGALTERSFRYRVEFVKPDGSIFINPKVVGAHIKITGDLQYTFNIGQYYVVKKVEESNTKLASDDEVTDLTRYNFLNFADIKEGATAIEADMDIYLQQNKVVVPKRLSILPQFEKNGDVVIAPIIMGEKGEEISFHDDFKNIFSAKQQVKTVYRGHEAFYVIKPDVEEALKEIKAHHRISKKNVEDFLKHPENVFCSPIFDFNMADYSERVIGKGDYKYKAESNVNSGISWLPPEGMSFTESESEISLTIDFENVDEVSTLVKKAIEENLDFIIYKNKKYLITAKLIAEIERILEMKQARANVSNAETTKDSSESGAKDAEESNKDRNKSSSTVNEDGVGNDKSKKQRREILLIDDNFADISYRGDIATTDTIQIKEVENSLNAGIKLLKHQKDGLQWLLNCYTNYKGALLADDMGLGKTLQTLAFIAVTRKCLQKDNQGSVLIVAPVSLLKNWQEEYSKFLKSDTFEGVAILDSISIKKYLKGEGYGFTKITKNYLVLTSYETLRMYQFDFGTVDWDVMVLDEAQKIKNPIALVTLASKAMKYKFGLCLTGTPVENTWVDLWSIMDFAAPGYHLGSLSEFKNTYVNELKKNSADNALIKKLGYKLNDSLKPLFLRRLKSKLCEQGALPELPKKIIIRKPDMMPIEQKLAYENIINAALDKNVSKTTALGVIAKLRDISLFPNIGTMDERRITKADATRIFNSSARLKVTFRELVNISDKGEKVLIFIESKKMQRILRTVIHEFFKINVSVPINGDMDGELRQSIVDKFNKAEGFAVLLLSPLAAGMGLNIASANHVIHLSRHWNPAKEDQATDRAYRIGQKKDVEVVIPMSIHPSLKEASFDQKLDELLEFKRQLSEDVLFPTADSAEDGIKILEDITRNFGGIDVQSVTYDINGVDDVDGITFERIVEALYNNAGMLSAKTSDSNDNGADVTVFSGTNKPNLLIQCKKSRNFDHNMGKEGIQEITAAIPFYESKHSCSFKPVVITNAKSFTSGAVMLAQANGVQLICRDELSRMLQLYPVEKIYF